MIVIHNPIAAFHLGRPAEITGFIIDHPEDNGSIWRAWLHHIE